jgi:hypothetical protein
VAAKFVTRRRSLVGALVTGTVASTAFVLTGGSASAAPTTQQQSVFASDDAYVSSTRTATNFGAADKLVVGRTGNETRVSYLKFVVPPLAAGSTLGAVQLRLPTGSRPAASTLSLLRIPSVSWTEKTISGAHAPPVGGVIATTTMTPTDTAVAFDVSKVVTQPGVYAFALRSSSTTTVTRLESVEAGSDTVGGPELRMTVSTASVPATPVPTTPVTTSPVTTSPVPSTPVPSTPVPTSPVTTSPAPAPSTTAPTTAPTTTAPTGTCVTGALLVPSCGVLWGAAAGGFTDTPRDQALKQWEASTGRTATIYHTYHKGNEKFPTAAEIAMTSDPAKPRVLLLNWKVAYGSSWAKVAAGQQDARIDAWASFVKKTYTKRFFLALHHEPENDINTNPATGMTAKDYAAMYRHVILRLRAAGVTNAVNVLAYMGNEKWMAQSWWKDLYPGDDVVDWIGLDSYVSVEKGYYHFGDFGDILDRQPSGGGLGFYDWSVKNHPTKPIMVAEWGMYHRTTVTVDKAAAFNTVAAQLKAHPKVKAVVYFDTKSDNSGDRDISIDSTGTALAAFKKLAGDPMFRVTLR